MEIPVDEFTALLGSWNTMGEIRPSTIEEKFESLKAQVLPENDFPGIENFLNDLFELAKSNPQEETIRPRIESIAKKYGYNVLEAVRCYLDLAHDADRLLMKDFYEDFEKAGELVYLAIKTMQHEGMFDLGGRSSIVSEGVLFPDLLELYYLSQTDAPVLIVGETGTGKELLAKAIHQMSKRRHAEFREINCAAIAETVLESELFGHEKGAFTGAIRRQEGWLEISGQGTFLLDELGKMPRHLQAKLLKVIEDKKCFRVGGRESVAIKVRFIAAIQPSDLKDETILKDLLYRLGFSDIITMPTLSERLKRLLRIAPFEAFNIIQNSIIRVVTKNKIPNSGFSIEKAALEQLCNHDYKGNFRELESILLNAIRNAQVHGRSKLISSDFRLLKPQYVREPHVGHPMSDLITKVLEGKLKDIFTNTDDLAKIIIEEKIKLLKKGGRDIKTILIKDEGLSPKEYQKLWKRITKRLGKGIRDI